MLPCCVAWRAVVSCCAVLCSVVPCCLVVPCCWAVFCVPLCCRWSFRLCPWSGVLVLCPAASCAHCWVLRCCAAVWRCAGWLCCAAVWAAGCCFSFCPLLLRYQPLLFFRSFENFLKSTRNLDTTQLTHAGRQQYQYHCADLRVPTRPRRWWSCLQGVDRFSPRAGSPELRKRGEGGHERGE